MVLLKQTPLSRTQRPKQGGSFWGEVAVLMRRAFTLTMRDPTIYLGRAIMFLIMCSFFSVIYIKIRDPSQEQILNRMWTFCWFVGPPGALALLAVYSSNVEIAAIRKEIKNGMVRPLAFMTATGLMQIPFMFLLVIVGMLVPMYGILDYAPENLPLMLLVFTAAMYAFETCAQVGACILLD